MTPEDVAALLVEIHATYGGREPTPVQVQSWAVALSDAEPAAVRERLTAWMREHCYRPTPADLRGVPRESVYAEPPAPVIGGARCGEPGCPMPRAPLVHLCQHHYRALYERRQEPQR